ncbi:MAG: ABC transporter permease [Spirochaetes bacterium]|nr:ABC transporter permease [Spirochaetota bacterium]
MTGGIDLSVGYVYGLSSVVGAKVMQFLSNDGMPIWEVILLGSLAALSLSLIPGFLNGVFITRFKVPSFIATMGMWGICNGVTLFIVDGFMLVMGAPEAINKIGNGFLLYIDRANAIRFFSKPSYVAERDIRQLVRLVPNSIPFTLIVLVSIGFMLRKTRFGNHVYAIGGSIDAAVRSGINVSRHLIVIYTLSSFLSGLAGLFNLFPNRHRELHTIRREL